MKSAAVFGEVINDIPNINRKYIQHINLCDVKTNIVFNENPKKIVKENDYLVVCGGGDIDPALYSQHPIKNLKYNKKFDIIEQNLILTFIEHNKAVLGICRGLQSINVALGGNLIQDIPESLGFYHSNSGARECQHEIKILKSSMLNKSMGLRAVVNSFHHQCIDTLGKSLFAVAKSHDGVIEAIESKTHKILGIQWHPERMNGNTVFEHFFKYY